MIGVQIGEKHTYKDWNLILTSTDIDFPDPKTETVDIPGADGELDFSEVLTGDISYKNRKISFEFEMVDRFANWKNKISEISNYIHGRKFKIILDADPSFYYYGRVTVNDFKSNKSTGTITIEVDVEPYKYDLYSSLEDWLWDSFNFETGVINETNELQVNGELEVAIYGRRKKVIPKITCNSSENQMQVVFKDETYNLSNGTQKILNIEICEGENVLKFIGNGTISIEYRGGSL